MPDDLLITEMIYDPVSDSIVALAFPEGPDQYLMIANLNPNNGTLTVLRELKDIRCSVGAHNLDKFGWLVFTAVPDCDRDESVVVKFQASNNKLEISAASDSEALSDPSSLFV